MKISELIIYPIKSAAPIPLQKMQLGARGAELDREMMVVGEKGNFLTQRQLPQLCLLRAQEKNGHWQLEAPGMEKIILPPASENYLPTEVWGTPFEAQVYPQVVNQWLSDYLKIKCSLVRYGSATHRPFSHGPGEVSFVDNSPLLVISRASLAALNARLEVPIPMDRFRANIIVEGAVEFAEDQWQEVMMGKIKMNFVKECSRCIITCTDQLTGKVGAEPLRTLGKFRKRPRDGKVIFGSYYAHQNMGSLKVGDEIRPLSLRS